MFYGAVFAQNAQVFYGRFSHLKIKICCFQNIVLRARQCGVKVVLVTHDQGQVARLADEVVFVHKGRADATQPTQEFLRTPASRQAQAYLAGELLLD